MSQYCKTRIILHLRIAAWFCLSFLASCSFYEASSTASYIVDVQKESDSSVLALNRVISSGIRTPLTSKFDRFVGNQEQVLKAPAVLDVRFDNLYIYDDVEGLVFKYLQSFDVYTFFLSRKSVLSFSASPEKISGIAVDANEMLYIPDMKNKRVLRFDQFGDQNLVLEHPELLIKPNAVLVDDRTGLVYVSDKTYGHIIVFDKLGFPLRIIDGPDALLNRLRYVSDMCFGPDGLYVLDFFSKKVVVFTKDGRFLYDFSVDLGRPSSIAVDQYNRVYLDNSLSNSIAVYDSEGRKLSIVGGGGNAPGFFFEISDLHIFNNELFVADRLNGRVQVYDIVPENKQDLTHEN